MTDIIAPVSGTLVALDTVSDPVFASHAVGDGVGIAVAEDGVRHPVTAPVSGKAIRVMPHAFVIMTPENKGVLVHVGIDTVHMKGESFNLKIQQGDTVEVGQTIVTFDPQAIRTAGYDPTIIVVAMDTSNGDAIMQAAGTVEQGEVVFTVAS